jgi:hypothetical protein
MKQNIQFIIKVKEVGVFHESSLTYDLPLDMLVLQCSWFNADWIKNPFNIGTDKFFKATNINYDFNNFLKGSFCYHLHNKWNDKIEDNSFIIQLVKIIKLNLRK